MSARPCRSALGRLALGARLALAGVALAGLASACGSVAEPEPAADRAPHEIRAPRAAPDEATAPRASAAARAARASVSDEAWRPERTWVDTLDVEELALGPDALWVASRGGLERFDAPDFVARRHYTTADGLDTVSAVAVRLRAGTVEALTETGRCTLEPSDRFRCTPRRPGPSTRPARPAEELAGERVTARAADGAHAFAATAGAGVWDVSPGTGGAGAPRRLTASDLPCGAHVSAVAEHAGALWVGTFHGGVCRSDDGGPFVRVADGPLLVNDLAATPDGLYAATSDGLFVWREAAPRFVRVRELGAEPVNRLAYTDGTLYATSIDFLHCLRLRAGATPRLTSWQWPAGSHSLQAVAARGSHIWLASEDRGAIRFDGRGFRAFDATTELPTSWAVDVALGADGSAYVATLRHG
ncbi:MAG: hypothetical protein IT373_28570, partial [Polyangiaceae bacterium]|nr:hypothetical protein [Polyangiaceae bacterium]